MTIVTVAPLGQYGMNKELDPQFLGRMSGRDRLEYQFQSGLNVDIDSQTVKKRQGLASFFSGIAGVPQLVQDFVDVNQHRWIIVATTTHVYTFDEVALTLTDRTPAGYAAAPLSPAQGETFQFKHYIVNGVGFWYWDAVAATYLALPAGSPQTARAIVGFGNHLLLYNVVSSAGISDVYKAQWCLDPDARVLTDDLLWVRAADMTVGTRVIGFDRDGTRTQKRKFRTASVLAMRRFRAKRVRVTLSNGASLVTSEDHKWYVVSTGSGRRGHGHASWVTAHDLETGMVIQWLGSPWEPDTSWEGGYLAGLFDGEGYVCKTARGGANAPGKKTTRMGFVQNEGPILSFVDETLTRRGIEHSRRHIKAKVHDLPVDRIIDRLRLMGMIRPRRLMAQRHLLWEECGMPAVPRGERVRIVSVEPMEEGDVVGITTTTGTLIAEGIATGNSDFL